MYRCRIDVELIIIELSTSLDDCLQIHTRLLVIVFLYITMVTYGDQH